jgi:ubiquinone/menaquinone biosynthesis C-methylase UbiE
MSIERLRKNWQELGEKDPLWAVLSWSDKKHGKWNKEEFFKTGQEEIDLTMRYLQTLGLNVNSDKALDFGSGVGRLTGALARYFTSVVGVDISSAMVKHARELNKSENCQFILNTEADLKIFPDQSFDFVYSRLTLQHIEPTYTGKFIKEFVRILKPGGVAVFGQPYKQGIDKLSSAKPKDILKFILENAPLEDWQADILSIVREKNYYFTPQRVTKIINED